MGRMFRKFQQANEHWPKQANRIKFECININRHTHTHHEYALHIQAASTHTHNTHKYYAMHILTVLVCFARTPFAGWLAGWHARALCNIFG